MKSDAAGALDELSSINRRLAAIAFADVAGFSLLMAADDVQTLRRWKALRTEVMEPLLQRHGGRIAEKVGDAVLVDEPCRSREAIGCADWQPGLAG